MQQLEFEFIFGRHGKGIQPLKKGVVRFFSSFVGGIDGDGHIEALARFHHGARDIRPVFQPGIDILSAEGGLLEFIDAWGQPIKWLRWPAGFPSDLNRYAEADAMDPQKTDWRFNNPAFPSQSVQPQTIIPLIYSAGPDGVYAIIDDNSAAPVVYATMKQASNSQSYVDPYFVWVGNVANGDSVAANLVPNPVGAADPRANRTNQMGSIHPSFVDASDDNITNHDLILEP